MMVQGAGEDERQRTTGRGGNGRRWMGLICEPRASNIATENRTRGMRVVGLAGEGSHQPKKWGGKRAQLRGGCASPVWRHLGSFNTSSMASLGKPTTGLV